MAYLQLDVEPTLRPATERLAEALDLGGALRAVRTFGGGKTDARVVLIEHRRSPRAPAVAQMVVKYDRGHRLIAEIDRYIVLRDRAEAGGLFTPIRAPEATRTMLAAAPDDTGALAYRYAAAHVGANSVRPLDADLAAALDDPTLEPWPPDCPAQVAAALAGLYTSPGEAFGEALVDYYTSRWLPDLEAAVLAVTRPVEGRAGPPLLHHPDFDPERFTEHRSDSGALADWCHGLGEAHEIRRSSLKVLGRWGGAVWARDSAAGVTLKLVPDGPARFQLDDVPINSRVNLWIRPSDVGVTRAAIYQKRASAAAPGWIGETRRLRLGRWHAPNPLRLGAEALRGLDYVRCGPAHGDLHPGNVLLAGGGPLFIDYGLAERDAPAGVDVARLVGGCVRSVLALHLEPPALIEAVAAIVGLAEPDAITDARTRRAAELLLPWREAWLAKAPETPWARHLLGFAFIGLKWTEGDADDPRRHGACLVLAALAAARVEEIERTDPPARVSVVDGGDAIDPYARPGAQTDGLLTYRAHLRQAHAHVVPFFQREGEQGLLEERFVQLELSPEPGARARDRLKDTCTLEELLAGDATAGRRWTLLGDPGAGKSTLARRLAAEMATRAASAPICVYVPLADWAESTADVFEFVEATVRACPSRAGRSVDGLADALRAEARTPDRLWLLLDGFDEIAPTDDAPKRVEQTRIRIEALAGTWPDMVIAVLTRPIGARPLAGFERARIARLDDDRQQRLLTRWLGETRARAVWAEVRRRPALYKAAGNPLLLSLLAKLVADRPAADLPATRSEVFGAAIDLLLDRGHCLTPRGLGPRRGDARRLSRPLALALTERGGESWPDDGVEQALDAICRADDALAARLGRGWTTTDGFLEDVAVHTGILGPHDGPSGRWRYLHRALRERLSAEALVGAGLDAIIRRIGEIADDPEQLGRWGETLGMAVALLARTLPPDERMAPLLALRAADASLMVRVLPQLTGLPPDMALDALWGLDPDGGDLWDGETLFSLADGWPIDDAVSLLMDRVEPGIDLDRLAFVHHALDRLDRPPERAAFFAAADRPIDGAPAVHWADIPAGDFMMGSPPDDAGRDADEGPQIAVVLEGFLMARRPVTIADYRRFDPAYRRTPGPAHPVTEVSWWRAALFAAWLDARLPTEAEWEYACRADTRTVYSAGDAEADLAEVGWYGANSGGQTHPVGEKPANAWGLYDMHGNVWEWCRDWFGRYPEPSTDGVPLVAPAGPADGIGRVARGGSCGYPAHWARSAYRHTWHPEVRYHGVGFRLVRAPRAPWPKVIEP